MKRDVPTVHESATVEEIFELLVSSSHKRVVVVDDKRRVVGIIADSDLISKVSRESWPGLMEILVSKVSIERVSGTGRKHLQKLRARFARELMTRGVITVRDRCLSPAPWRFPRKSASSVCRWWTPKASCLESWDEPK
jgi:CBS domain-containing protein